MNKKTTKKALAIGGCAILAIASFGAGAVLVPREVVKEVPVEKLVEKEVLVEVPVEVVKEVEVIKEVEVVKEVMVQSEDLKMVLEELVAKNGNVEFLTEGLDDDEIDLIVERLVLTQEWEALAVAKLKDKLADELDKTVVNGVKLDEDYLRSIWVDSEAITFEDMDFDQHDVEVVIPFKVRQNDVRYEGVGRVIIRDGEVDDFIVDSIEA
jgi:hypothetical protein